MNMPAQILTKAQVTHFRGLKQSKNRSREGLFLLEGSRLCQEAFNSDLDITACIIEKDFEKLVLPKGPTRFQASRLQIAQISDSKNPQGIICIAKIPQTGILPTPESRKTLLVLDRLADPGNMGTIFRSALWFGVTDILLSSDCVDPYSPKVVRASMGAIASLNIHFSDSLVTGASAWINAGGAVAALHMKGAPLQLFKPEKGLFLILGSEAHGVLPELLEIATPLSIESPGIGESLNAAIAAGIALYELSRNPLK